MPILSRPYMAVLALAAFPLAALTLPAASEEHGKFVGDLKYTPIGHGNHKILEYFEYVDPEGEIWGVPKGTITDGASIPRVLWSLVGSPFTGDYIKAAVVHDHFCDMKSRGWKETHRVFYHAMRAGGEPEGMAKLMYLGVYYRGPRWSASQQTKARSICIMVQSIDGEPSRVCKVAIERVIVPVPFPRKITTETLRRSPAAAEVEKLVSSADHQQELARLSLDELDAKADNAWRELEALNGPKKKKESRRAN